MKTLTLSTLLLAAGALALAGCNCGGSLTIRGSGGGAGSSGGGTGGGGGGSGAVCAFTSADGVSIPVDLIIAIDQSASMGQEIQGVIDNVNQKLAAILAANRVDYRVILIGGDFCIQPPLTASPSMPGCAQSNLPRYVHVPAPVNSSDALTLMLWTYDGFYKQPNTCVKVPNAAVQWKDKLRFEAMKVFIAVTDDDPSSFSYAAQGCTDPAYCAMWQCPTWADRAADWPGGRDFPTELYDLQPQGMFGTPSEPKWIFHSIVSVTRQLGPTEPVSPLGQVCAVNGNTGETSGVEYQKLSVLTGGTRFPTCDTDYSPVFQKIAGSLAPLGCEFSLVTTGAIDPANATVTVDPGNGQAPVTVPRDDSAACHLGADGYQLAANGTRVKLCGSACALVTQNAAAKLSVEVGCAGGGGAGGGSGGTGGGSGGVCLKVGEACSPTSGASCCVGLACSPGPTGDRCDSLIK